MYSNGVAQQRGENLFNNLLFFSFSIPETENHIHFISRLLFSLLNSTLVEQQCDYATVSGHNIDPRVFA